MANPPVRVGAQPRINPFRPACLEAKLERDDAGRKLTSFNVEEKRKQSQRRRKLLEHILTTCQISRRGTSVFRNLSRDTTVPELG